MAFTLVTGGVRSGKSACAERLAGFSRRVLYVATGQIWDDEMQARIDLHRERRPESWGLLEVREQLADPLAQEVEAGKWEALLLDDLSTWVSTILINLPEEAWRTDETRQFVLSEARRLADFLQKTPVPAVVVTSETGLGGVALTPLGRAFQDLLGEVNQLFAARAEDVYLVVSGRPLRLPSLEGDARC
jgi:adenosylcobinamide kinase/adenosylcobinamide-phosphate guanylyltransferase